MGIAEPTLSDTAGNPGIELSELFSAAYWISIDKSSLLLR